MYLCRANLGGQNVPYRFPVCFGVQNVCKLHSIGLVFLQPGAYERCKAPVATKGSECQTASSDNPFTQTLVKDGLLYAVGSHLSNPYNNDILLCIKWKVLYFVY